MGNGGGALRRDASQPPLTHTRPAAATEKVACSISRPHARSQSKRSSASNRTTAAASDRCIQVPHPPFLPTPVRRNSSRDWILARRPVHQQPQKALLAATGGSREKSERAMGPLLHRPALWMPSALVTLHISLHMWAAISGLPPQKAGQRRSRVESVSHTPTPRPGVTHLSHRPSRARVWAQKAAVR